MLPPASRRQAGRRIRGCAVRLWPLDGHARRRALGRDRPRIGGILAGRSFPGPVDCQICRRTRGRLVRFRIVFICRRQAARKHPRQRASGRPGGRPVSRLRLRGRAARGARAHFGSGQCAAGKTAAQRRPGGPAACDGGYPLYPPPQAEIDCECGSRGIDPGKFRPDHPQAADIQRSAARWGLLLQITSNSEAGWQCGDGRDIFFYGDRAAMERGDFSQIWMRH
ncbi:DUF1963 domain-containing protein [Ramlibacter henchirensis]|uniref:DUF1963 domain-containing protein n=1 Tax=Ramlibacter henchirensis TaxID=204072 RepID=A0A4Z0BU23_9BURK|nr:DUF1963 domain-containing protein [Ramlibacter henchirensis]